ncbi:MAG TPA: acyltransferase [Candidatus Acidoferrales bacterium]|nr:acyltransferase [Candidatus Acidoferrales bacterium]
MTLGSRSQSSTVAPARFDKTYSVYLDLVRGAAALVVFLSHACKPGIADAVLPHVVRQGLDAVTVFFVLSGFVISHTAESKDHTLRDYILARLARLWSVAIPALVLAAVVGHFGAAIDPELYRQQILPDVYADSATLSRFVSDHPAVRFAIGALFLNEVWGLRIIEFHNAPYWSLSYEFCYYLLFAACFYLRSWARVVAASAVALLFGPKIILLLPIWLMGVALHRWRLAVPAALAWPCVVAPLVAYILAAQLHVAYRYAWFDQFLPFAPGWSEFFVWQYLLGMLVSINLLGFRSLRNNRWILRLERPIRALAGQTLSLYLFHFPILYFLAAVLPAQWNSVFRSGAIISTALLGCYLLSRITEARKSYWRKGLNAVMPA